MCFLSQQCFCFYWAFAIASVVFWCMFDTYVTPSFTSSGKSKSSSLSVVSTLVDSAVVMSSWIGRTASLPYVKKKGVDVCWQVRIRQLRNCIGFGCYFQLGHSFAGGKVSSLCVQCQAFGIYCHLCHCKIHGHCQSKSPLEYHDVILSLLLMIPLAPRSF